ncbi:MAG: M60 family metallopeptidase [Clostridia bacterium]|nr:M60 family metallopeptidase [Clostridia bacterium]
MKDKSSEKEAAKPAKAETAKTTAKPATKVTVTAKPATKTAATPTAKPTTKTTAAAKPAAKATATTAPKAPPVEEKPKVAAAESPEKVKKEKPAKAAKTKEGGGSSAKEKFAAIVRTDNFKIFGIIALSLIMVLCLCLGLIFGLKNCNPVDEFEHFGELTVTSVANSHKNKTQVGYSGEILGSAERHKPVSGVHDEGLSSGYPKYNSSLGVSTEQKTAIIQESRKLTANGTWVDSSFTTSGSYDKMDKDGYLYKLDGTKPGNGVPERLYKHTASVGLYNGNVDDKETAVVKRLTFKPRSYSSYYNVTGLYAPAGEVIKIQLSAADMNATGGITIHIGQALYNGQANNIWEARDFNRMPVILNTMSITKQTATYDESTGLWTGYVGSFLGGPIYVRDEACTFSVTVSGGVNYAHFILGVTTEEEYAVYAKSSAPYFDLEVWDRGVLHSGPKTYAQRFSYNDLYKAAILWEKISLVTTNVSNQGIVFLYDPFVAAGAAVAFPGRRSVNCPMDWMVGSLDYEGFVTSGSWGNVHEYHHNFQDYGVGDTGEVTNNGLNLVAYSLFTKISSARQIEGYGGAGLSGWNQYTSATWALNRVNNNNISGTDGLAVYATLLHNFGQDAYIQTRGAWGSAYYDKWANYTHQDMTYYASLVSSYGGNYSPSQAVQDANYPLFVPVSSVYQTGRTYKYDNEKREIITMQPFVIPYGKSFNVDLNEYVAEGGQYRSGSVIIGNGFNYNIKEVKTDGINGTFVKSGEKGIYTFTPNSELRSGKIYVTLEITYDGKKVWNGHELQDVDLILEFQQSHETNKNVLERTTYFYTAETAYTDAREAYEKGYAGYSSKNDRDHSNPTQNCNTDIWYCTESSISDFPNANPELDIVTPNSIDEVRGKLYFPEAGKYNIYLRGRKNCAVYYSIDGGNTYQLGTYISDNGTSAGWREDKYFTLELEAESWVYFKEVLINVKISDRMAGFIGLGIGQWIVPMYNQKLDADGNLILDEHGNPVYVDANGNEVSAEEASDSSLKPPKSVSYATAYRQAYEFQKQFESDYFYLRTYSYNYKNNVWLNQTQTVVSTNYASGVSWNWSQYPTEKLVDGDRNTIIHTNRAASVDKPFEFVIDMGEEKSVNRMVMYTQYRGGNGDWLAPKDFKLEGSLDGVEFFTVGEFTDVPRGKDEISITVNFEEKTFRYYKLTVTRSDRLLIISEIEMWNINEINGGTQYSPDDVKFSYKGTWQIAQSSSSFGHVYLANSGAEASFDYDAKEGGRIGILSSSKYGQNFEVYIDGNKVESISVKNDPAECAIRYITPELSQGTHKVVIKCVGEANIDSIVFF